MFYEVVPAKPELTHVLRVWFSNSEFDRLVGNSCGAFRTFLLTPELTGGELRKQVVRSLIKGKSPEEVEAITAALQVSGATICVQPIYGGEYSIRRLKRAENVMSVISTMRQTENQIRTLRSVSKKNTEMMTRRLRRRLQRGSGVITQKKSEQTQMGFLATQALRIVVTVHRAECLIRSTDVNCTIMINAQKFETKTVKNTDSPSFEEEFVFGVNSASADQVMVLKLMDVRTSGMLGELEINLESLVALASGDDVIHLLPLTAAAGTLVTGNIRISVLYCDALTSSTRFKLTPQQMAEFCRIQPSRLFVSVLQVENMELPPPSKKRSIENASDLTVSAKFFQQVQTVSCAANPRNSPFAFQTERMQIGVPAPLVFEQRHPLQIYLLQLKPKKASSLLLNSKHRQQHDPRSSEQPLSKKSKKHASGVLAVVRIPLTMLRPNTQLTGFFPLCTRTGEPLGQGRIKVRLEYLTTGPWTHETAGRICFRPPPCIRRKFSCRFPFLEMQIHQTLPIRVRVKGADHILTDDLGPGELECRVTTSTGEVYYIPAHKDFAGATIGVFRIDFDPPEPGEYSLIVTYDESEVQKKPVTISVKPSKFS